MIILKRSLFLFILYSSLLSCNSKSKSVHLIDNFYSYQSHDDLKLLIDNPISISGKEDKLSDVVIYYTHLNNEGKLGLRFFEDQLVAVGFYPSDTLLYLSKVESELGIDSFPSTPFEKNGVTIYKGYDYEMGSVGGLFVVWSDAELIHKYKNKVW